MKKTILIIICILMFLVTMKSALSYPTPTQEWHVNDDCNSTLKTLECGNVGGFYSSDTPFTDGGKSLYYTGGAGSYFNSNYSLDDINLFHNYTISFWFKGNGSFYTSGDAYFAAHSGNNYLQMSYYTFNDRGVYVYHKDESTIIRQEGNDNKGIDIINRMNSSTWHMITLVWGGKNGTLKMFINGTENKLNMSTFDNDGLDKPDWIDLNIWFMEQNENGAEAGQKMAGFIDGIRIWNNTNLTDAEVLELYNDQRGTSTNVTLNYSMLSPTNSSLFNWQPVVINSSINSSEPFNCSLYINNTLNITRNHNFTAGKDTYVEFNASGFKEGHYNFSMSCYNYREQQNSSIYVFVYDVTPSQANVTSYLDSNLTIVYGNNGWLTAEINFSDTNLWGVNITVDTSTVIFNRTGLDTTFYKYNLSFKPNDYGLSLGTHTLTIESSDSHTNNKIKDYKYKKNILSKSITYEFGDDWIKITPTNKGLFSSFNTKKLKDRYTFEFQKDWIGKLLYGHDMEFEVTSSERIYEVNPTEYPGHLIVYGLKKWIDFDTGDRNVETTITRIREDKVLVSIKGIKSDNVTFSSIGGLNVVSRNYTFYYGNMTETYLNRTLESDNPKFTLNFTRNSSHVSNVHAVLHYNFTQYSSTNTVGSNYIYVVAKPQLGLLNSTQRNDDNMTFFWSFNITNAGAGNPIMNFTNKTNQTVYKMIVSNCSGSTNATTKSLNFTTKNELNNSDITSTVSALFTVFNRSSVINRNYASKYRSHSSSTYCIYPSWAELRTDYNLEFTATGYKTRNRIVFNERIAGNHTNITVYMLDTGNATTITITVVDEFDNPLNNYIVESWRYNLATDDFTLIETKVTNLNGIASLYNLFVSNDEYMFKVRNPSGVLVHTEPKTILSQTTYTFRVILGKAPSSILTKLQKLDFSLTRNKTSKNFTLTWDDSTTELINAMNLTVRKQNASSQTILNSQRAATSTGTLYHNLSENGIYYAYAYATSKEDGEDYLLKTITLDLREEYDIFGTDTLVMAFLFVGTMAFIGIAISGQHAIIYLLAGLGLFTLLGFVNLGLAALASIIAAGIMIIVRLQRR